MPGVRLIGLGIPAEQINAVVYEHPAVGAWCDVYVSYVNGDGLTASNASMGKELDSRPGQEKVRDKDLGPDALLEIVRRKKRPNPCKTITADNFASTFEEHYAKEMAWRLSRGGVTLDEVRRTAQNMGRNFTEEQIQEAYRLQVAKYKAQQEKERGEQ
jgi:hypothetical protein